MAFKVMRPLVNTVPTTNEMLTMIHEQFQVDLTVFNQTRNSGTLPFSVYGSTGRQHTSAHFKVAPATNKMQAG